MKILHISNYYSPHIGGIEQVARDVVNAFRGREDVVQRVFCFRDEKGTVSDEVDGVPVLRSGCFAKISSQSLSFSYGKELKREFLSFEPDLVVFHFPNPFASHYLLKRLKKAKNCRLIVWYHLDITKQKILGKFFKGQTARLMKRAEKIVATSPNYAEGSPVLRKFPQKRVVVPNCVDESRFRKDGASDERIASVRAHCEGKTVCFAMGRHVPYKGLSHLVEASKYLDDGFRIYIGGTGPLTEELKRAAAGDEKIVFLGKLGDGDLKTYYAACDIFCFPSVTKNEAFGISLAEAMHFGKPAVTFTVPGSGVNYVGIADETCLEVENGNAVLYAEALKRLASDGDLRARLGAAARARAEELFSHPPFRAAVVRLIEEK